MNLLRTFICFLLAFFLTSLLTLATTGISASQGIEATFSLSLLWQLLILSSYATLHKLGLVTAALALFHYFSPAHWPKPILTVIAGFILALLYNTILLHITTDGQIFESASFGEIFQYYLIYYCIGGMAIGLIGSILCKRLIK